ncbi:DUF2092 domain-containing protein [Amorphus sp. MBR-141]
MRFHRPFARGLGPWVAAAVLAGSVGTAAAQGGSADPAAADPDAVAAVQAMTDHLAGMSSFAFDATTLFDEPVLEGAPSKRAGSVHVAVKRPDKLFFEATFDDGSDRKVWFDGTTVTLANVVDETYIALPFDGDTDGLIEAIQTRLGLNLPVLMFARSKPFDDIADNVLDISLGGTRTLGDAASTLVDIDTIDAASQLWIADGGAPLPERLVITYVRQVGDPEYILTFDGFSEEDQPDATFEAQIPDGWTAVELSAGN